MALRESKKAVEADRQYAAAYYNLGVANEKLEKATDALAAYTTALFLNHAYVSARINLAVLYNKIGEYDESI